MQKGVCMNRQIAVVTVTAAVFVWSAVMVAVGETSVLAALAPILAPTLQRIVHTARPHAVPDTRGRLDAAADKEDDVP